MALKIGPCPKDCDEVTHAPNAEDLFTCSKCGEEVTAINV